MYIVCVWDLGEWERKIACKTEKAAKIKATYYEKHGYTKTKIIREND